MVEEQVKAKWGCEEAQKYDPETNCLTFRAWSEAGYKIKKGAKALKSQTFVEVKDKKTGEVLRKYPRTINLFYYLDVEEAKKPACRAE